MAESLCHMRIREDTPVLQAFIKPSTVTECAVKTEEHFAARKMTLLVGQRWFCPHARFSDKLVAKYARAGRLVN